MSNKRNGKGNAKRRKTVRRERGHWLDANTPPRLQPGYYLPIHPGLTDIECPDCGATWSAPGCQRKPGPGGALAHALTCPSGKGYANASDSDREWFADNPEATERVRLPTMAEVQAVMLATGQALPDMPHGGRLEPGGYVVVRRVSDDLRIRDFTAAVRSSPGTWCTTSSCDSSR